MLDSAGTAPAAPALTLASFAAALALADIPAPVLARAKLLILDALGCAVAANAYPFSHAAVAGAVALAGTDAGCSVIGRSERLHGRDGTSRVLHVPVNGGAGSRALGEQAVVEKFIGSATTVLPRPQAERIRDIVLTLQHRGVAELAAALRRDSLPENGR